MEDMGYKEAAVQGVYGEALDTMIQEVRDAAESMAVLDVLERMCRKAQLETAKRAGSFEFASLSVSDILAVMGRPDCYEAVMICKEKAEEKEAEA